MTCTDATCQDVHCPLCACVSRVCGGGVVLDSDPEAELQETLHKSRALFRAAADAWRYS